MEDAPGDKTAVDIVQARGSHNRVTDELVHVIVAPAAIDIKALASPSGRPPGNVCLNIWTRRTPGEDEQNFDVCATPNRGADGLRATVNRHGRTGAIRRLAAARAEVSGETKLELRFDPDDIGRPASYRWNAESSSFGAGCPDSGCADLAPERGKTVETRLGTAR